MIAHPADWKEVGKEASLSKIEFLIIKILKELDCQSLSLSGGVDSALLLSYLVDIYGKDITCYTIACSFEHEDSINSHFIANKFGVKLIRHIMPYIPPTFKEEGDLPGDEIVRAFYNNLKKLGVKRIITGDGIDELMGGYYYHMKQPGEKSFFRYLAKLQKQQLIPLDKNSGQIEVLLPYLDFRLINLLSYFPTWKKFDSRSRKKIIYALAKKKGLPSCILERRKYGFCDAMRIK